MLCLIWLRITFSYSDQEKFFIRTELKSIVQPAKQCNAAKKCNKTQII